MVLDRAFCTVAAANYLASVRTLCQSLQEHHPDTPCYALFIDEVAPYLEAEGEPFKPVTVGEIGMLNSEHLRFMYDVTEFATVVKPRFFQWLMETKASQAVIYLDPDILVTNSLAGLFNSLADANVILTPHLDSDFPRDGCRPATDDILTYGLFNLGFLALKKSTESLRLLAWWEATIIDKCTTDHATVHFVDQKAMDLAPCFFDKVLVERSAGYNVAHWNLHSRYVDFIEGRWTCNHGPLYFFHFSGFSPLRPKSISRANTRPLLESQPTLEHLLKVYAGRLRENGFARMSAVQYGNSFFENGEMIQYTTRQWYRRAVREADATLRPFGSSQLMQHSRRELLKLKFPRTTRILVRLRKLAMIFVGSAQREVRCVA